MNFNILKMVRSKSMRLSIKFRNTRDLTTIERQRCWQQFNILLVCSYVHASVEYPLCIGGALVCLCSPDNGTNRQKYIQ